MQPATTCGLENDESVVLLFDAVDDDGDEFLGVDFGVDLATCRLSSRAT